MEKKILKNMTVCSGVLTALICVCLYFLPNIKENIIIAAEMRLGSMQESSIQIEETGENVEQLNIELPEGADGKDISITNDYLSRTIYVRFAHGVDNYSENYSIRGSSNNIANLSYYKDGEAGILAITLDKVCELSYYYKDGYLCMNIVDPHDIYDKIIVIDAGHGGSMPGAVKRGVYEKNLNLEIVLQLKAIFDEADHQNIKVYYTRLDDTNPSLFDRADLANYVDADLFISVHNNSSSSGRFNNENGTMVLYSPGEEDEACNSERLAEICLKNVNASAGTSNLGLVKGDDIYIVRSSDVPVALIEVGYMTNTEELENLSDPEFQKKVAEGIYNAIMEAFEEGF